MLEGAFEVVMLDLVEAVHVELPHEAVHLVVPKVPGQHYLFKFRDVLYDELSAVASPVDDLLELLHLNSAHFTFRISKVLYIKTATSFYSAPFLQLDSAWLSKWLILPSIFILLI